MTHHQLDQPRDRIGQFASTNHAEALNVTLNPALSSIADEARARRLAHQNEMGDVGDAIAVDSAVAMAAHTRSMFPKAQRIVLIAPNFDYSTATPYEVLDGEGYALATSMYGGDDAFNEWAGDGEAEGNLHLLAADVEEHGGRLDGVLTDRSEGPGNYVYLELDIDKALSLELDPLRATGIDVTAPAPVLDGFTAAEVEDYLAREQHERQCACDLKDDICCTEPYGEHWRHRMGVPDVEGIFDTIKEMAAARDALKESP